MQSNEVEDTLTLPQKGYQWICRTNWVYVKRGGGGQILKALNGIGLIITWRKGSLIGRPFGGTIKPIIYWDFKAGKGRKKGTLGKG